MADINNAIDVVREGKKLVQIPLWPILTRDVKRFKITPDMVQIPLWPILTT